jgi:hypothetical protein
MGHASLSETYDATLRGSAPDRRWDTREPTQLLEVLVLYLERPTEQRAVGWTSAGRFGYSDLKEAAPMEGYAL